ncbi:PREDICTED: uncharacterized protein CXorf66-like [Chrysochloris asiatica]|uniref:Uncharacterized protein CXorf66-like n=1 Tax=Chrysochloris asiatica TaxID=185453 RepID=A0A9B0X1F5_CHRAS|nr:PREDICTED: uncharacterized protein CXorf66-like [Chrysochloris asiatica]
MTVMVTAFANWTLNGRRFSKNALSEREGLAGIGQGTKQLQSTETKMDSFRKHLLVVITGITIIVCTFMCFCFLHHYCLGNDAPKGDMTKKQGRAAKSSRLSPSQFKSISPNSPEKQPMLSWVDTFSVPLSPTKSSLPSSTKKLLSSSGTVQSSLPSSAQMFFRPSSPEKSSLPSNRISSRLSSLETVFRSSRLENLSRTSSVEKTFKVTHTHKRIRQIYVSYSYKPMRPSCRSRPQKQNWPPEACALPRLAKPSRHPHARWSHVTYKTTTLSRSVLPKTCRYYKERCLVCNTSEPLLQEISEMKIDIAQPSVCPSEVEYISRSFHKMESIDNALGNDVGKSAMETNHSDDDSDKEILLICNVPRSGKEVFPSHWVPEFPTSTSLSFLVWAAPGAPGCSANNGEISKGAGILDQIASSLLVGPLVDRMSPGPSTGPGARKMPRKGVWNWIETAGGQQVPEVHQGSYRALLASTFNRDRASRYGPAASATFSFTPQGTP